MSSQEAQQPKHSEVQKQTNTHGLLGMAAGIFVGSILQPLEIIKMGLIIGPENNPQLKQKLAKGGNIFYNTYLVAQHIFNTEGAKGFFRSYIPSVLRNGGGSGVYFWTLQELDYLTDRHLQSQGRADDNAKRQQYHFINSAIARVTSTVVINPISVVGSRIEVPGFNQYTGMLDGFKQVYQNEGWRSFFRGGLASSLKDGPFAGLYLVIYRNIKDYIQKQNSINIHYTQVSLISGLIAGVFATMSSHPLEIIRARLQVDQQGAEKTGIVKELTKIYREEGFQGYFRGITPRLVKKPLANSLTFVAFEFIHFNVYQQKW